MSAPAAAAPAAPRTRSIPVGRAALLLAVAAAAGIGGGVALHRLQPARLAAALPAFHGQAVWAAGRRPAPDFTLRDQAGALVSLRSLRGRPVVLTFLDSQCKSQCPLEGRALASVLRRLPAASRPTLVILTVDPEGDTRAGIRRATAEWGLAGPWRWHWLNGTRSELRGIWRSYGVSAVPQAGDTVHSLALYLIDRSGSMRTAYLFPFLPGFVQRDLARLAAEPA